MFKINKSAQSLMAKNNEINEAEARKTNAILYDIEEDDEINTI